MFGGAVGRPTGTATALGNGGVVSDGGEAVTWNRVRGPGLIGRTGSNLDRSRCAGGDPGAGGVDSGCSLASGTAGDKVAAGVGLAGVGAGVGVGVGRAGGVRDSDGAGVGVPVEAGVAVAVGRGVGVRVGDGTGVVA